MFGMLKGETELSDAEVIEYVDSHYNSEIILLGGSRAQGTSRANSDWDLYLIGNFSECERYPQFYRGADLDIAVYPKSSIVGDTLRIYFGPVGALRILRDNPSGDGQRVVEATRIAYERGPQPLTREERARRRHELARLLSKAEPYLAEPTISMLDFTFFYQEAVPLWFALRGKWSLPLRSAWHSIESEDPGFAHLLETWCRASEMPARLGCSKKIIAHLFGAEAEELQ